MNRNYRVVFNQSTGTYVAVAENTTARKKSKTTVKTIVAALSVSAVMMGVSGEAQASWASSDADKSGSNADNYVLIGPGAKITSSAENGWKKPNQSIAIGAEALVTGDQSTALGNNVIASGHSSVAIGGDDVNAVIDAAGAEYTALTGVTLIKSQWRSTQSAGHGSIAIGVQSLAEGNFSTALGLTAKTQGTGSVAFGANAQGLSKGATSIGTASVASGQQATAIGMNSTATAKNATAIGSGGSTPATATKATADGAIAIGGNSVKGSQATGKNAIAIGGESIASEDNAVAIGVGAKSTHGNSVALGTGSVATGTNIGNAAWQPKDAAGNPIAVAGTATGEVSIGKAGGERRITNMAAGSADTDGVNVSQLKALDYAVTDKLGELNNNITAVGGKVSNLQTSVNTLEQGWKLQSDGDVALQVKAGNTVAINSGTNIDVERKNNTITVNTTKDMTLNSVSLSDTAGNKSVLTSSGLNVSNSNTGNSVQYGSDALTFSKNGNTANAVSVGVEGINAGNQTITNVAAGALNATSEDAVNGSQLFQTNQNLNQVSNQVNQNTGDIANLSQGWKLQSDSDTASAVKAGDTVQINSGKNIDVSRDGNTLTIATADDLNLNSVNLQDASGNNSVLNASGLNVSNATGSSAQYGADQLVFNQGTANAVSIGNAGINAGNQTITNVADGAINSASKDAINGSQLYDIQQEMQEHIKKAEDEAGLLGSTAVHYDSDSRTHITLGGANATSTVGISNLADGKVEAGSTDAVNGGQLYQTNQNITNLDNQVANLSQGWNLQSDGDNASAVKAGDTVQFNSGKNIDVSRDGNTLTIATADDLVLNSVNLQDASGNTLTTLDASGLNVTNSAGSAAHYGADQLVFNQGTANAVSIGNTGINAGNQTITNVADGAINSASKDAINGSQLYDIQQEMQEHIKKAEDEAGLLGSTAVHYDSDSKTHITLGGANATSTVGISNLADGKVEAGSTDAVNGGQLYAVDQKVDQNTADITHLSQGWKIQSDGDTASSVVAGDTVEFNSGKNIEVSRDGNTLTIATADDLTLNSVNLQDASGNTLTTLDASGLNVSSADGSSNAHYGADQLVFNQGSANAVSVGETGISAGNQIISNVAAGDISSATSTDAVNGGQLYQTNQNVAQNKDAIDHLSQGWKIQSDGDTASSVVAGDTVQINSGKNIEVSRDGNTLTIATANDLELGSVTTVDGSGKSSVLDATGLQVDAGNGAWSSYGAGGSIVADDQGNQTSSTPTGTTVKDSQGNSTQVNSKGVLLLSPAGTELASLNQQQLSFSNGKPGESVTIGMNGISAGNQKITNVADGTIGAGSKDAVNGGQLFQTNKNVTDLDNQVAHLSQGWNIQSDGDSESAVRAGDTVAINSGKNIEVVRVGKDITINTSDDLVVNSLVADDGNGNTMSLTATELYFQGANGQHTVIDATAGLTVADNAGNFSEYTLDGMKISNGGNTITIANDNVSFGGNTLTNVAAGVNADDAVNKGQLDSVGNSTANALGGSSSYDAATGTVNAGLAVGGNTFTSVQDALNAVNQQANAGWKVSTEKGTTYSVAPNETVDFSNTDDNVVIKNTNGDITVDLAKDIKVNSVTAGDTLGNTSVIGSGGTTVTDAAGNVANYGANSSSFTDTAGNNSISSAAGTTLTDAAGNTYITTAEGSKLTNANGDITNLTAAGTEVTDALGNNASYGANGISIGNTTGTVINIADGNVNFGGNVINGVGDGVTAGDAVNKGQLDGLGDSLSSLGLNFAGNAGNTVHKDLGQTLSIVGAASVAGDYNGKNVKTITDAAGNLQIQIAENPEFDSVIAGDTASGNFSVIGSGGTTVTDAAGNVANYGANSSSFTDTAGNNSISSATGTTLTDAAGNTYITTAEGSKLTNANGDETKLTAAGTEVTDALGNNASYGANGISIGNTTGTVINIADGNVNFGGNVINGVGDGVTAGDAVNKGQLDGLGDSLSSLGLNFAGNAGNTVHKDLGQTLSIVGAASVAGDYNGKNVKTVTDAAGNLQIQIAENPEFDSVIAGDTASGNFSVIGSGGTTVTDAAGNVANYGANSSSFTDTAGNNSISSAAGTTLTDAAGNTYITTAEGSKLTNANGDETKLTAAGTEVTDALGNNASYGANGISIGNTTGTVINIADGNVNFGGNVINGVGDGVTAGDAVNKGQLDGLGDSLSSLGLNFAGNAGNTVHKDLGQTLSIVGAASVAGDYNGKNVKTITDAAGNLQIQIAENPEFDSVIAGDTASGNFSVIGSGGTTVTDAAGNVANYGANSSSFTDTAGNNSISSATGTTLTDAAGNTYITTAEGSKLTNANGDITNLTAAGTEVTDALGNNASYGANGISIGNTTGTVINIADGNVNFGGNVINGVGDGVTAGDAVNKGQLDGLGDSLSSLGLNFAGNAGNTVHKDLGQTLSIVGAASVAGDYNGKNVKTITDAAGNLQIQIAENPEFDSVIAGDTASGNFSVIGSGGTTVTDAAGNVANYGANSSSFTDTAGNNSISSATGTTLTDAAGNTYITTAEGSKLTNANGDETKLTAAGTEVTDALGNNASYGANGISIGNTTGTVINIADGNVNFGGNVINGVGDGVTAGDAVNKGQLDGLGDSLSSLGLNFAGNAGNTVHKDLGQTLSIVGAASVAGDYNGKNVKTITDAAGNLQIQIAENPEFDSVIAGDTASGNFSVIGSGGTTVTDAAGNVANYGANSSSFTDTAGNNSISSATGTTLTDAAGNTYITTAEGSKLTNANGDITNLTAAGTEVTDALGNNASYGANGISIGNTTGTVINIADGNVNFGGNVINGVGDGVTAGDAVNKGQLDGLGDSLSSLGLNFAGNAGNTVHKDLGQTLSIVGAASVAGDYNGKNVKTITDAAGNLQIQIAENPEFDSVIAGDTASGNFSVIGSGGTTVTDAAGNVANYGANSSSFTDTAGNNSISSATGTTLTDAAGNTYITTAEGSKLTNANGDETKLTAAGTEVTDALGNNASYGANGISIGNTTGTVINIADGNVNFGGNVINGVGDGVTAGDAVNKGQLDGLGDSLSSLGLNFAGNAGNTVHKDLGQTLSIVGAASVAGDYNGKNVKTVTDAAGNLQIQIAENPEFDSVIAGDTASGNFSVIGSGGTTVTDAAGNVANYGANSSSFTDTAGNNSISSAAGTTLTDAAGNTYITTAEGSKLTNANGDITNLTAAGTEVTDALGNNASYGANGISIGNTTGTVINIADGNVNFGGNVINGVGDGVTAGDAVNKGQLDGLGDSLSSLGLNFAGNAGNTVHKDLGQTLSIVGAASVAGDYNGKNVKTITDAAGNLQIQIAENPEFDSVIAGDTASGNFSVIGSGGTTVTDAAGNVANYGANSSSFTDTAGNNSISSATGTTLTDAAGNTYITTAEGSKLTNANGDETKLTAAGTEVTDALGNNASYGANGISIGNTTGTVINIADGNVNFGGNVINGVGDGVTAGDAVNKGQLDGLGDSLSSLGLNFAGNAGNTVHKDLGQTLSIVGAASVAGDYNGKNVKTITDAAGNLQIQIAENPEFDSVIAGDTASGNFSVIGSGGTTVTDAAGNVANYGANSSSFTDTAGNNSISSAAGTTLTDAAGNTYITTAEGSKLTNANGDITNLTAAGTEVTDALGNNASYGANGISIGNTTGTVINIADGNVNFGGNVINGVGDGVTAGDAVNKGQLDGLGDSLSSLGLNFAGNAGNTVHKDLGQTLSIVGAASVAGDYNGKNVKTITDAAGNLQIQIAENPEFDSVIAGDTASGNFSVIGSGGTTVTDAAGNVANYGANSSSFTDTAGNNSISSAAGTTLTDAAGNTYITTAAGSELINANGDITNLTAAGTEVTDALGNNATYGANGISIADAAGNLSTNVGAGIINVGSNTHTIAIDGNTGEITGLSNTKYDPNNIQADRAATEGQLVDLDNKINNAGFNISAQGGVGDTVTLGETVDFSSSDSNLAVKAGADNQILFTLSSDITLNSISMQDAAGNVNYVDATGSRVADALGNNAFYGAIGSQFTDKAGNSFNSSATGSIVTNAKGDSTNVSAGNISVSTGNGGTVNIGGNGIDAGGNNITNVADGKAPGDAVNKGQLDTAVDNINNSIGAAINGGVQYDKNADGTVNKGSITLEGGANGTTITNVANGKVEAGSKDAVNGGQLHDALQQINNNQSTINNDILGVTVGPDGKPKLDLDIYDVANQTKTGNLTLVDAINTVNQEGTKYAHTNAADESEEPGLINPDNNAASAGGKNSSAFGVNAIVDKTATNGLAMGYQSQVGAGATNAVSIGSQTQANGESSLALGHGSQANGKQSISIGTGNIVNGNHSGAIGDPSIIEGDNSYSIGNNNTLATDDSFVLGNNVTKTAENSVNLGSGSVATTEASKHTAGTTQYDKATIGGNEYAFAGGKPTGVVTVGAEGEERRVQNVAAGLISKDSTDAINGSQLHATNQAVGDLYQMNNKLNNRIDGLEDESRAGVATALAVANLPQVYIPGKSGLAIATGVHKGEVGYALGYSSISEGGNWVFKASATANRMGDVGGGAGLLYMFD